MSYIPKEGILSNRDFLVQLTRKKFVLVSKRNHGKYYNIPSAFDIEVSSFYDDEDNKVGVMYSWAFGIDNLVTMGRDWECFSFLLKQVKRILHINEKNKLIIYVHNLSYEFQFMRQQFIWDKVFSTEKSKPIYALMGADLEGYEFRCSLKLSGKKLALLSDDLLKYPISKMEGDLDYSKIRLKDTPLTDKELKYIENDIRVILHYIQEKIEDNGKITKIPLTMTGYVRNYCRESCFEYRDNYTWLMNELRLDVSEFNQLKRAFAGGFTHANALYVEEVLANIASFDFTSSYPYVMLSEKFPMSKCFEVTEVLSEEDFEFCLNTYCCLFELELVGLTPKLVQDFPLSLSKCYGIEDYTVDNGRISEAKWLCTTVTEQDFFTLREFYNWEGMRVYNLRLYKKNYLPKSLAKSILTLYKKKTELKDVEGKELDYMLSKNMLNSVYGMCVTNIVRNEIVFTPYEDKEIEADVKKVIPDYNSSKTRFLFYPWGVWVTAYARRNLFTAIKELGNDYVYADTDSVKVRNYERHLKYFNDYNERVKEKLNESALYWGFKESDFSPKNKEGKAKPLGVWDFEGLYDNFKTLGAKRYLVQKGNKFTLTVAGVNKRMAMDYIEQLVELTNEDDSVKDEVTPFDFFNFELHIPPDSTGKNILTYINDKREGFQVDYLGKRQYYQELSCIHMEPTDYSFDITDDFRKFIKGVKEASW